MSATGLCAMLSGFIAAGISDRIGRKPVVVTACLLSLLTPLAALYFHGPIFILGALMFIGWIGTAAFALFMAIIPGETLPRYAATAAGVVACMGEMAGGGDAVCGRLDCRSDNTSGPDSDRRGVRARRRPSSRCS